MTGKKEILQALKNEFAKCVPEAEHYFGKIGEGYSPPAFLYLPSFNEESRHNAFFQDTNREIQIIYFGRTDGYGTTDFDEKLEIEEKVTAFLNTFLLPVGNRTLLFTYETQDALRMKHRMRMNSFLSIFDLNIRRMHHLPCSRKKKIWMQRRMCILQKG